MKAKFHTEAIDQAAADLVAIGFCEEERPLRGAAGLADWRLHGFLSKAIIDHKLSGRADDVVLVPTHGRLPAPWLILVGLGSSLAFDDHQVQRFASVVLQRAKQMQAKRVAVFYPHMVTLPPYHKRGLSTVLAGFSAVAAQQPNDPWLSELELWIPSHHSEEVHLAEAMASRLTARHSL